MMFGMQVEQYGCLLSCVLHGKYHQSGYCIRPDIVRMPGQFLVMRNENMHDMTASTVPRVLGWDTGRGAT